MNRFLRHWRWYVLAALLVAPVLVLIGFGLYYLWSADLFFWVWWPLMGSLVLAFILGRRWQKQQRLAGVDFTTPIAWTERDRQAWRLVEARAKHGAELSADQLTSVPFYLETAEGMALELARFYHPGAQDPIDSLTIPEILAVVELASHDLALMVDENLPGGHLLTINDMKRLKQLADWYPTARNVTWLISSVFSPLSTAVRYLAVQAGVNRPWQLLQDSVLIWFFTAFVHRLGSYLIELNGGRLAVGARRFRELQAQHSSLGPVGAPADEAVPPRTISFALIGQTKAGKSSLINAILGERKAETDVLPATSEIERYELQPPGVATRFRLFDTVGYGNQGPREDRKRATEEIARECDVILLVVHARNPARQSDLDFVQELHRYFDRHPDVHKPPVLAVLTHIDLLSPSMEWQPPYDWQNPSRPKEREISQAVAAVQKQFGTFVAGVVPVCTAAGKTHGVQEWLLPALIGLLDQAHAVAFLRCLKAELNEGKVRKVFDQLLSAGKGLVEVYWQSLLTIPGRRIRFSGSQIANSANQVSMLRRFAEQPGR